MQEAIIGGRSGEESTSNVEIRASSDDRLTVCSPDSDRSVAMSDGLGITGIAGVGGRFVAALAELVVNRSSVIFLGVRGNFEGSNNGIFPLYRNSGVSNTQLCR